jgi:hypothetical protein
MDDNRQLTYVKKQVDYEIALFTQRKHFNRKAAFAFTVVPASLAAFATVSIGASKTLGSESLPILAMIATGIASILGAWESLFANRKLWRVNNVALTKLYELKSDIEYREQASGRSIAQEETDEYFARLKAVREEGEQSYQRAVGNE